MYGAVEIMGPSLPLSKTGDILQRAKGLTYVSAAFLPWQICGWFVGYQSKRVEATSTSQQSHGTGMLQNRLHSGRVIHLL